MFSFHKQKYLRRFYGLPAGLQGRQRSAGALESKIKEMQKFFKLKVSRSGKFLLILLEMCSCFCVIIYIFLLFDGVVEAGFIHCWKRD